MSSLWATVPTETMRRAKALAATDADVLIVVRRSATSHHCFTRSPGKVLAAVASVLEDLGGGCGDLFHPVPVRCPHRDGSRDVGLHAHDGRLPEVGEGEVGVSPSL